MASVSVPVTDFKCKSSVSASNSCFRVTVDRLTVGFFTTEKIDLGVLFDDVLLQRFYLDLLRVGSAQQLAVLDIDHLVRLGVELIHFPQTCAGVFCLFVQFSFEVCGRDFFPDPVRESLVSALRFLTAWSRFTISSA